jgi:hypothetical protein
VLARFVLAVSVVPATHVVMGACVLLLDVLTGPFLMFPVLFVVPVSAAAWFCSRRLSTVLAVALPVGRVFIAALYEFPYPLVFVLANAAIRVAVLLLISYLVSRTAKQTKQVKSLEGLLPICMFCKRIRDQGENWHQLESYISQHSEARFSHTFCPECGREHYGKLVDDDQKV